MKNFGVLVLMGVLCQSAVALPQAPMSAEQIVAEEQQALDADRALNAITTAPSEEAAAAATIQFMDAATPEQMARAFGQDVGLTLDLTPSFDAQSMMSLVSSGGVDINVSISTQTLTATYPGGSFGPIKTSTAGVIGGHVYSTKQGCFTHPRPVAMYYSKKYDNSPMPHALFYYGGFAIHGTYEQSRLGHPASHGCVRISLANAATLYGIVQEYGAANTRICVGE